MKVFILNTLALVSSISYAGPTQVSGIGESKYFYRYDNTEWAAATSEARLSAEENASRLCEDFGFGTRATQVGQGEKTSSPRCHPFQEYCSELVKTHFKAKFACTGAPPHSGKLIAGRGLDKAQASYHLGINAANSCDRATFPQQIGETVYRWVGSGYFIEAEASGFFECINP